MDSINVSGYQWSWLQQSPCSGRNNWSRGGGVLKKSVLGQLDGAMKRGVRSAYLVIHFREALIKTDTCRDLGVGQKLTTTDAPFAFSFSRIQGKRVERTDLASEVVELTRRLYVVGVGQNVSSHSEPSLKIGEDSRQLMNKILT